MYELLIQINVGSCASVQDFCYPDSERDRRAPPDSKGALSTSAPFSTGGVLFREISASPNSVFFEPGAGQ